MPMRKFKSVDHYIEFQPKAVQDILTCLRRTVRAAIPRATEVIAYNMPSYRLDRVAVLYFAAWKNHYSLYPVGQRTMEELKNELAPYEVEKGTIRFPFSEPVPKRVIARIAKMRAEEVSEQRNALTHKGESTEL